LGEQLFLERYIWFDHEIRQERLSHEAEILMEILKHGSHVMCWNRYDSGR